MNLINNDFKNLSLLLIASISSGALPLTSLNAHALIKDESIETSDICEATLSNTPAYHSKAKPGTASCYNYGGDATGGGPTDATGGLLAGSHTCAVNTQEWNAIGGCTLRFPGGYYCVVLDRGPGVSIGGVDFNATGNPNLCDLIIKKCRGEPDSRMPIDREVDCSHRIPVKKIPKRRHRHHKAN